MSLKENTILKRAKDFGWRIRRAEIDVRAAALAFHTLLAIVPMLALLFWYLAKVGLTQKWFRAIKEYVFSNLSVDASQSALKSLDKIVGGVSSSGWGYIAVAIFLYTTTNMVIKLGNGLDKILETRPMVAEFKTTFLRLALKRAFVMLMLPIALAVGVFITTWLKDDSWFRYVLKLKTVGTWVARPLPMLVDTVAFFLLYSFVPQRPVKWFEALKAAVVASACFELAKWGMSFYSKQAIMTQKIYGALAAIPLFVIWIQLVWTIILSAALLIRVDSKKT